MPTLVKIGDNLIPPQGQVLRNMRHHLHYLELHGVVGNYPEGELVDEESKYKSGVDTYDIVKKVLYTLKMIML